MDFSNYLRQIPDHPKPGVIFQDITTLLANGEVFKCAIQTIAARYRDAGITKVAGMESRGFIFAATVAAELGVGFVPFRKKGKLPWKTYSIEYALEYGTDTIEVHQDAFAPDDNVLIVDDIIATGGTARATLELVQRFGVPAERIHLAFFMDIADVPGKDKEVLKKHGYFSLI
jgi:adenine phosphoribosyltransferase